MIKITSLNNDIVKYYRKLMTSKKERDQSKLFIVEGEHLVEEAIKEKIIKEIIISDLKYDHYVDIPKIYVSDEVMKKICDTVAPQGIIAICHQLDKDITCFNRLLLLDDLQDPGNIGTIIRTADAFGFDGVILSENTVDIYNPKVVRATQGALFRVNIIKKDLDQYLDFLIQKGVDIYGTSLDGEPLSTLKPSEKMAFIMGNEGNGVSRTLLEKTKRNMFIEMSGKSESLNVAIASSIIMYIFRN